MAKEADEDVAGGRCATCGALIDDHNADAVALFTTDGAEVTWCGPEHAGQFPNFLWDRAEAALLAFHKSVRRHEPERVKRAFWESHRTLMRLAESVALASSGEGKG